MSPFEFDNEDMPSWQCPVCGYWNGFFMDACGGRVGCPGKKQDGA